LIDVEDGAEEEFGPVEGIGEVGDIGKVAVRHANDVVDAEGGFVGNFGVSTVIEVFFVSVEETSGSVGIEARLMGGSVEVAPKKGVIGNGEAKALDGGDEFREEDALEEGGDVREWKVVGSGEIIGFGNDAAAGLVGAAFEDAAEGAGIRRRVELGGLFIKGIALRRVEADGVGVAVGGGVAGSKSTGDADVGVAELGEALVERALAEEFIEAVVSDVVADEEHALDVVADGGGLVGISGGSEGHGGLAAVGGAGSHDGAAVYTWNAEVVELFEGERNDGEFDQTGGVEVLLRIEVKGMWGEGGTVLGVAVDLGVDDLKLVLGVGGDAD